MNAIVDTPPNSWQERGWRVLKYFQEVGGWSFLKIKWKINFDGASKFVREELTKIKYLEIVTLLNINVTLQSNFEHQCLKF